MQDLFWKKSRLVLLVAWGVEGDKKRGNCPGLWLKK